MVLQIRYIFGRAHQKRDVRSSVFFERGLKIPALYCNDCCTVCNNCLDKTKTRKFKNLDLCEKCHNNRNKLLS